MVKYFTEDELNFHKRKIFDLYCLGKYNEIILYCKMENLREKFDCQLCRLDLTFDNSEITKAYFYIFMKNFIDDCNSYFRIHKWAIRLDNAKTEKDKKIILKEWLMAPSILNE